MKKNSATASGDDVRVDLAEVVLDLLVDLADDGLPDDLELGRDVVVGVLGQLAPRPEAEEEHDACRRSAVAQIVSMLKVMPRNSRSTW